MILICGRMFCVFSFLFFPFCFVFTHFQFLQPLWATRSVYPVSQHMPQNPRTEFRTKGKKKKFPPPFGSFSFLSCKGNLEMFQKHQVFRIN